MHVHLYIYIYIYIYMCVCVCVWGGGLYIYICIFGERVDFGESDKIIKISGKMDKSDTYTEFSTLKKFLNKE